MQFHFYDDDTQLNISFSTKNDMELTKNNWGMPVRHWEMDVHQQTKTKQRQDRDSLLILEVWSLPALHFGTDIIKASPHARNIGTILDTTMSMVPRVNNVCKSAFYHPRTMSRIRKYLSTQTTEILIHVFVTSKSTTAILYHIISLKNVIEKHQSVQNAAARLITRSRKCDHIPPISSSIFSGYLFLDELNSRFYYLPLSALHQQSPT